MLSTEDNEILSHVGPGTLLGNLLRRYWTPALLSDELPEPDCTPVKVRMMGEDLVAIRDTEGRVGLFDVNCPHRGTSLFFGRNEENGLRCVYHGWKFDVTGQCVDMPSVPPDSNFRDKVRAIVYPTHESGGIIWTYMGPKDKMPGFRDFGTETLPREKWRARKRFQPQAYLQNHEAGIDTVHPSWLHMWKGAENVDANADGSDTPGAYNSVPVLWRFWWEDRAPRVEVVSTWFGFKGAGLRTTPNGNTHLRYYHFVIPGGSPTGFKVPIDDVGVNVYSFNTIWTEKRQELHVKGKYETDDLSIPESPYSGGIDEDFVNATRNLENDFLINRELQKDGTIYSGIGPGSFLWQDIMASQTSFLDRTKEHLATIDRKIIMMRRVLLDAAKNLENGIDPPANEPDLPYDKIEWPDKVLREGEDWQTVGTESDPDYWRVYGEAR